MQRLQIYYASKIHAEISKFTVIQSVSLLQTYFAVNICTKKIQFILGYSLPHCRALQCTAFILNCKHNFQFILNSTFRIVLF